MKNFLGILGAIVAILMLSSLFSAKTSIYTATNQSPISGK